MAAPDLNIVDLSKTYDGITAVDRFFLPFRGSFFPFLGRLVVARRRFCGYVLMAL